MHVDGEEGVVAVESLPRGDEGLAAVVPGRVGRVDAAGVVLELGAREHLVGRRRVARVGVAQLEHVGPEQIRDTDVAARRAAVLVVDRRDVGVVVRHAAQIGDGRCQGREGHVRLDDAVVRLAVVVLDLLDEEQVGSEQIVDNMVSDIADVGCVAGRKVLNVVVGHCQAGAYSIAGKGCWVRKGWAQRLDHGDVCQWQDMVEPVHLRDDTGDIVKLVTELAVGRVVCAVERISDSDRLRVAIWRKVSFALEKERLD